MGLERRYIASKRPVPDAVCHLEAVREVSWPAFVLRIDGTDLAAMEALRAYAMATPDAALAGDLAAIVDRHGYPLYNGLLMLGRFKVDKEAVA